MKINPKSPARVVTPKNKNGKKIQKFLEKVKQQFSTETSFDSNERIKKRFINLANYEKAVNNYLYVVLPNYSDVEWKYLIQESNKFITRAEPVEEYLLFMMSVTPRPKETPKPKEKKIEVNADKAMTMEDLAFGEEDEELDEGEVIIKEDGFSDEVMTEDELGF